ncbi:MAG TPA: LrgB family protein [Herpetosiphonaceae bacterium]
MDQTLSDIWVYLASTPLLWLTVTVAAFECALRIARRMPGLPLLNPVLLTVTALVLVLVITDTPYATYFAGAQFIHFLLGPATVALALPLYRAAPTLRRNLVPLLGGLLTGALASIISVVVLGRLLGLDAPALRSLTPKSVTTPIAMEIAKQIGGLPSLTAVFVILTGILGATFGRELLDLARVRVPSVRGFAMGMAAHGIGTARALQLDAESGAFAGLAIGLHGALASVLVPLLARLLGV